MNFRSRVPLIGDSVMVIWRNELSLSHINRKAKVTMSMNQGKEKFYLLDFGLRNKCWYPKRWIKLIK